jgi:hypothetical protein
MKELCHFTFKDKTSLSFETIPVEVKQNYVKTKNSRLNKKVKEEIIPLPF